MSQQNMELVREAFERFSTTGEFAADRATEDFVWDMSNFHGWPEQRIYEGAEGVGTFLAGWVGAWAEWNLELEELHDAGDSVVAFMYQRGTSNEGVPVEMSFAQVWTIRDGKQARMEMYSDRREALVAVGLEA